MECLLGREIGPTGQTNHGHSSQNRRAVIFGQHTAKKLSDQLRLRQAGLVMLNPRKGQVPRQFTQINGYPETFRPAHPSEDIQLNVIRGRRGIQRSHAVSLPESTESFVRLDMVFPSLEARANAWKRFLQVS